MSKRVSQNVEVVIHCRFDSPLTGADSLDSMGGHDWMGIEMKQQAKIKKHRSHISGKRFMASKMGKRLADCLAQRAEKENREVHSSDR